MSGRHRAQPQQQVPSVVGSMRLPEFLRETSNDRSHSIASNFADLVGPEEMERFIEEEGEAFRDDLATACFDVGVHLFQNADLPEGTTMRIPGCTLCNLVDDCPPNQNCPVLEDREIAEALHKAIIHLDIAVSVMTCKALSSQLRSKFEQQLTMEAPPGITAMEWGLRLKLNHDKNLPLSALIAMLAGCSRRFPRGAQAAASLLSLLVVRRPALCFAQLSHEITCVAVCQYIDSMDLNNNMRPANILAYTRVLPLLFYFGSWPVAFDTMKDVDVFSCLVGAFVALLDIAAADEACENSKPATTIPEDEFVFSRSDIFRKYPASAAAAATIEIISRYVRRGVPLGSALGNNNSRNALTALQDHEGTLESIIACVPNLTYTRWMIQSLAKGKSSKASGMLSSILKDVKMCHFGECHLCVPLNKCAGCGLACYCSREHQKLHWQQHKEFCKHQTNVRKKAR